MFINLYSGKDFKDFEKYVNSLDEKTVCYLAAKKYEEDPVSIVAHLEAPLEEKPVIIIETKKEIEEDFDNIILFRLDEEFLDKTRYFTPTRNITFWDFPKIWRESKTCRPLAFSKELILEVAKEIGRVRIYNVYADFVFSLLSKYRIPKSIKKELGGQKYEDTLSGILYYIGETLYRYVRLYKNSPLEFIKNFGNKKRFFENGGPIRYKLEVDTSYHYNLIDYTNVLSDILLEVTQDTIFEKFIILPEKVIFFFTLNED